MRLGPRVLCSLDPNWQAASKAFSILTESADPVKVHTSKLFISHTCGRQKRRGARGGNVYPVPHVIFQTSLAKSPPHNYFTLLRTHAPMCMHKSKFLVHLGAKVCFDYKKNWWNK